MALGFSFLFLYPIQGCLKNVKYRAPPVSFAASTQGLVFPLSGLVNLQFLSLLLNKPDGRQTLQNSPFG